VEVYLLEHPSPFRILGEAMDTIWALISYNTLSVSRFRRDKKHLLQSVHISKKGKVDTV
jgi:hypothetical protein